MASKIRRYADVPYSREQMFNLVNDVDAYPQFLPGCRSASARPRGEHEVEGTIELAKGALHKSFTTRNTLKRPESIDMRLVSGPFRRLHGTWSFTEVEGGKTRIALELEFEFANRLMAFAIGPVFTQIANSLVDAFVQRAREVHGDG
ncbi:MULTISPECIES: type II toxin-antitoxin system RatA family toxin [Thioalkalivibrio]|uniref:Ribosome association toxin RatA n=1 Tax=Thioalkalivibrio versutus TaxID=106634 RepID=A0A0G3G8N6_9GAMM|nr:MULTISPECIES: type II toxin-antitoxin system RatA family toxin [Thioalkalivibrio]AKJ95922.1 ribosome association toxin RatA [Thioalkalivibrio versutus]OOC47758.1 ubiquinone-binding protein [Thioalkalivibrio versutus]